MKLAGERNEIQVTDGGLVLIPQNLLCLPGEVDE